MLKCRILGQTELVVGSKVLRPRGGLEGALLTCLAAHAGDVVTTDRLIDALWPNTAPPTAKTTLQVYVSNLRKALDSDRGLIETAGGGYRLAIDRRALDVGRFEELVNEARRARHDDDSRLAQTLLSQALSLWRGRALESAEGLPFAQFETHRLESMRAEAHEDLVETLVHTDEATAATEAELLVQDNPLRERRWYLLMLALYRAGRQAEALQAYQRARTTLGEELGIEPGPTLQRVEEQILLHDPALTASAPTGPFQPLPAERSTLVGRDDAVKFVRKLIDESRLVTVTGYGGVGKTRIALRAGRDIATTDSRAVAWVSVSVPELATDVAVAVGCRIPPGADPLAALTGYLRQRDVLIVLDGCEATIEAAAELAAVFTGIEGPRVLATSREPLGVDGETVYRLPPLELSNDDGVAPAEQLFVERASAASPDIGSDLDLGLVSSICRRTGGLPLAIELLAARAGSIGLAEMANALDFGIDAVAAKRRTDDPRQRGIADTVAWSYDLLSPEQQRVFRAVAYCQGAVDAELVEAVTGGYAIGDLAALVEKSLTDPPDESSRGYRMLDPVREYGYAELAAMGELDTVAERHARYHASVAAQASAGLASADRVTWIERMSRSRVGAEQALEWAITAGSADLAFGIVPGLCRYLGEAGLPVHGAEAVRRLIDSTEGTDAFTPMIYPWAAWVTMWAADGAASRRYARAFVDSVAGASGIPLAEAHHTMGNTVAWVEGRFGESIEWYRSAIDHFDAHGSPRALSPLGSLAYVAILSGARDQATAAAQEFRRRTTTSDDPLSRIAPPMLEGTAAYYDGDLPLARKALLHALGIAGNVHMDFLVPRLRLTLGWVEYAEGALKAARHAAADALRQMTDAGGVMRRGDSLVLVAMAELGMGNGAAAERALARAAAAVARSGERDTVHWVLVAGGELHRERDPTAACRLSALAAGLRTDPPLSIPHHWTDRVDPNASPLGNADDVLDALTTLAQGGTNDARHHTR